jgi:anti-sigma factor RsiW
MNCTHARQVLDAHIDNELDDATSADIARHLAKCPDCAAARAERDTLRRQIRAEAPYFTAPAQVQHHIERFSGVEPRTRPLSHGPTWFAAGAFAMVAALAGLLIGFLLARPVPEQPLHEQIIASHVASLGDARRLIEVAASDRHVIKPWFQGKIDFAPAVRDLSADGFALVGARLDHIADRQAAAVVYRIREHVINVYVWRAHSAASETPSIAAVRGFGVASWATGGMHYAAVSDVDTRDLQRLAQLLATP